LKPKPNQNFTKCCMILGQSQLDKTQNLNTKAQRFKTIYHCQKCQEVQNILSVAVVVLCSSQVSRASHVLATNLCIQSLQQHPEEHIKFHLFFQFKCTWAAHLLSWCESMIILQNHDDEVSSQSLTHILQY
jgi:hypothetical protein